MKRLVKILSLGLCLTLTLSACQNGGETIQTGDNSSSESTSTTTELEATTEESSTETTTTEAESTTTEDASLTIDDYVSSKELDADVPFNINLPVVNFDSDDASAVNSDIAELETRIIEQYEALNDPEGTYEQLVDYTANLNEDILSLVVTVLDNYQENEFGHFVYNFDVNSGALLSDEELVSPLADSEINLDILREEVIAQTAKSTGEDLEAAAKTEFENSESSFPSYLGLADQYLGKSLLMNKPGEIASHDNAIENADSSKFYLGENGELMMIGAFPSEEDVDLVEVLAVTVDESLFDFANERRINPLYAELLEVFEISEEDNLGLIAFIGPHYVDTFDSNQEKLTVIDLSTETEFDPSPLLSNIVDEQSGELIGTFLELYLIIPKYENDIVRLFDVDINDAGDLVEIPIDRGEYEVRDLGLGSVLLGLSTETLPTGAMKVINLTAEDELFYPHLSARDGSFVIPDNFLDITPNVDSTWENANEIELEENDELRAYVTGIYGSE